MVDVLHDRRDMTFLNRYYLNQKKYIFNRKIIYEHNFFLSVKIVFLGVFACNKIDIGSMVAQTKKMIQNGCIYIYCSKWLLQ